MPTGIVSQPPSDRKSTAEASCSDVMNENSEPTSTPRQMSGSVTSRNERAPVAPTLAAASSMERCTSSSEAYEPRSEERRVGKEGRAECSPEPLRVKDG